MYGSAHRCELCETSEEEREISKQLHGEYINGQEPPDYLGLKRALNEEFDRDLSLRAVKEHFQEHVSVIWMSVPVGGISSQEAARYDG